MLASGVTMDLAEWIIDDICLVKVIFYPIFLILAGKLKFS